MPSNAELEKLFPVDIDLCKEREVTDYDKPEGKGGKRPTKKVTDCPTLYISGAENLDQIPEDGYVLIKIHRASITVSERSPGMLDRGPSMFGEGNKEGKNMSVELEVHTICLPEGGAEGEGDEEDKDKSDFGESLDRAAEKLGLKGKKPEPEEGESDEEESEAE